MSLNGFTWNQAELGSFHPLNNGIVMLISFTPQRSPRPIGTAFIIGAYGNNAIAITAAHNFQGVQDVQIPEKIHHPTALPEFLGKTQVLDLDRKKVRAICSEGGNIEVSVIGWAFFDKKSDIAIFSIIPQRNETACTYFKSAFILDDACPKIGDEVAVLGFANMKVPLEERDKKGYEQFQISRQLILRCGKVTNIHLEGHILCRGPCIETSIPVFSGMSGGPVMVLGKGGEPIKPFGLVSSDPDDDESTKNDRSVSGSSIAALLQPKVKFDAEGQRKVILQLNSAFHLANSEFLDNKTGYKETEPRA